VSETVLLVGSIVVIVVDDVVGACVSANVVVIVVVVVVVVVGVGIGVGSESK
jgi:hypothetical protein